MSFIIIWDSGLKRYFVILGHLNLIWKIARAKSDCEGCIKEKNREILINLKKCINKFVFSMDFFVEVN